MRADDHLNITKSCSKGWHIVVIKQCGKLEANQYLHLVINYGGRSSAKHAYIFCRRPSKVLVAAIYIKSDAENLALEGSCTAPSSTFIALRIPGGIVRIIAKTCQIYDLITNQIFKLSGKRIAAGERFCSLPDRHRKIYIYGHKNRRVYRSYKRWIATFERGASVSESSEMGDIKFSIILPLSDANADFLKQAISSVAEQVYKNWELCISGDVSSNSLVRDLIIERSLSDRRINVDVQHAGKDISDYSNHALTMASGDYCILLGQSDLLRPHSLSSLYEVVRNNSQVVLVYTDHDNIDEKGRRYCPHFKPQFNPDMLFSKDYIGDLTAFSTVSLRNIGGWHSGYVNGSHNYDVYLRLLDDIAPEQVMHIPKILYHRRSTEESTVLDAAKKNRALSAGFKSLRDYMATHCPHAQVEQLKDPSSYRVRWPLPRKLPLVSIVIPTKNELNHLSRAIASVLRKTSYYNYEIIVVDNNSTDEKCVTYLDNAHKLDPRLKVIYYKDDFNFAAINNVAVQHSRGDILCLMNNDIEIINSNWLAEMVSHAVRSDIGCVGAKLYYKNGSVQHAGVVLGGDELVSHIYRGAEMNCDGYLSRLKVVQNLSALTGALMVVEKSIYNEVGGLDSANFKIAYNDIDFCLKVMNAGYRNLFTPYAMAYHHESLSRGHAHFRIKNRQSIELEKATFYNRWKRHLENDPAHTPNLFVNNKLRSSRFWPQ